MARRTQVEDPTLEDLKEISEKYSLCINAEDLLQYQDVIKTTIEAHNFVEGVIIPQEDFSHRSFTKPVHADNTYNAWCIRCNIKESNTGKLHGKRIAVKDSIAIGGLPMTVGSRLLEGYIPEYDATVVKKLLQEGGTIIGKTTCDDLCFGGAGNMCASGPILNPYNPNYCAGGSSSGSAVVVYTGEADMALGTDQAGSIRSPASMCGIIGLKPTHGLVSYVGASSMISCVDHIGPMTRTVADCALLLEVIAGFDDGDYRQHPYEVPPYTKLIYPILKPSKIINIGVLQEGIDLCTENVKNIFSEAVQCLESNALVNISSTSIPDHTNAMKCCIPFLLSGELDSMINGCGCPSGISGLKSDSFVKMIFDNYKAKAADQSEILKWFMLSASYIKKKYGHHLATKASSLCHKLRQQYDDMLQKYDVLILPTINISSVKIPDESWTLKERIESAINMFDNAAIFNITGHPALTLNCGFDGDIPVGMMFIGKHFDEVKVLNVASIVEEHFKERLLKGH